MTNYNYLEAMTADVLDYIEENIDLTSFTDADELEAHLNNELWTVDSVTGNASGSYTFNRWTAREYVIDNMELLDEMADNFGIDNAELGEKFRNEEWEYFDVSIRCYLLGSAIAGAIEELDYDFSENDEEDEDE